MNTKFFAGLAAGLLIFAQVSAAFAINTNPLPLSTYITVGNLDWTWAAPINEQYWGSNELMAPSFHQGWRFATEREFANHPSFEAFLRQDNSVIQSAEYWNTVYTHVDNWDFQNGYVSSAWGHSWNETLYVRDAVGTPLPLAASVVLFGSGFAGLIGRLKRKANA